MSVRGPAGWKGEPKHPAGLSLGFTPDPHHHDIAVRNARRIGSILRIRKGNALTTPEITPMAYHYDTAALRDIQSFEDAMMLVQSTYGDPLLASAELGDGFELLKDKAKDRLIGEQCLFVSWSFADGDYADEFVAARVVTKDGGKYVIIDGGTGIRKQLREFTDAHGGRTGGLYVARGLRRSDYQYTDESGKPKDAATYYVDTSA